MITIPFRHQEVIILPMILEHHVKVFQRLLHESHVSEGIKYIVFGRQLTEIHKKVMKLIIKGCDRKGNYNLKLTEPELYTILSTPWEGMNNTFISNMEMELKSHAHRYFINQTLSPVTNPLTAVSKL